MLSPKHLGYLKTVYESKPQILLSLTTDMAVLVQVPDGAVAKVHPDKLRYADKVHNLVCHPKTQTLGATDISANRLTSLGEGKLHNCMYILLRIDSNNLEERGYIVLFISNGVQIQFVTDEKAHLYAERAVMLNAKKVTKRTKLGSKTFLQGTIAPLKTVEDTECIVPNSTPPSDVKKENSDTDVQKVHQRYIEKVENRYILNMMTTGYAVQDLHTEQGAKALKRYYNEVVKRNPNYPKASNSGEIIQLVELHIFIRTIRYMHMKAGSTSYIKHKTPIRQVTKQTLKELNKNYNGSKLTRRIASKNIYYLEPKTRLLRTPQTLLSMDRVLTTPPKPKTIYKFSHTLGVYKGVSGSLMEILTSTRGDRDAKVHDIYYHIGVPISEQLLEYAKIPTTYKKVIQIRDTYLTLPILTSNQKQESISSLKEIAREHEENTHTTELVNFVKNLAKIIILDKPVEKQLRLEVMKSQNKAHKEHLHGEYSERRHEVYNLLQTNDWQSTESYFAFNIVPVEHDGIHETLESTTTLNTTIETMFYSHFTPSISASEVIETAGVSLSDIQSVGDILMLHDIFINQRITHDKAKRSAALLVLGNKPLANKIKDTKAGASVLGDITTAEINSLPQLSTLYYKTGGRISDVPNFEGQPMSRYLSFHRNGQALADTERAIQHVMKYLN